MFKVKHIGTNAVFTVYAVQGMLFLFYDYEEGWIWQPMNDYKPMEG